MATRAELQAVHDPRLIDMIEALVAAGGGPIDQLGVRRVFILDWDVHHGNGTAEIFQRPRRRTVREHPPGQHLPGQRLAA